MEPSALLSSFISVLPSWLTCHWFVATFGATVAYFFVRLFLYPTFFPLVISYPWPQEIPKTKKKTNASARTTAVLAGSYNPPHLGHLDMLKYLCEKYDQVIVVVGMNPKKKYAVTPQDRADLIGKMLSQVPGTKTVKVMIVSDYIWRHLERTSSRQDYRNMAFCRGIRTWEKDGSDELYLQFQNTWGPLVLGPLTRPLPTIFLEGNPAYNHVSSSLIRSICSSNKSNNQSMIEQLGKLVPPGIVEEVARLYGKSDAIDRCSTAQ